MPANLAAKDTRRGDVPDLSGRLRLEPWVRLKSHAPSGSDHLFVLINFFDHDEKGANPNVNLRGCNKEVRILRRKDINENNKPDTSDRLYQIYRPSYVIHTTICRDTQLFLSGNVTACNTSVSKHPYTYDAQCDDRHAFCVPGQTSVDHVR